MKRTSKLGLAIAASAFVMGSASAATVGSYAGIGLGASTLDTPKVESVDTIYGQTSVSSKKGGLGARLFAGYNFNEYLGLELGVTHYADSTYKISIGDETFGAKTKATYSENTVDLVGKAYLPISDSGFNLYALGGVAATFNKFKASTSVYGSDEQVPSESTSYRKFRPKFGAGVSYAIDQNVSANFEVTRVQSDDSFKRQSHPVAKADMAAFTVSYNFG